MSKIHACPPKKSQISRLGAMRNGGGWVDKTRSPSTQLEKCHEGTSPGDWMHLESSGKKGSMTSFLPGYVSARGVSAWERAQTGRGDTVTMRKPAMSTGSGVLLPEHSLQPYFLFLPACP